PAPAGFLLPVQSGHCGHSAILRGHSVDNINKKGASITLTPCFITRFGCSVMRLLVKTLLVGTFKKQ
ncbi:hypothetical protein QP384_31860, partial [Klebsiella pneumoniae]|uniref:hypothetical protein n=1 Tax=Klebsiella pneumoniae TaxID=573 RepID=UPI002555737E